MKTNEAIIPVILAGGAGTRLWPLSRKSHPKQFSNLLGEHSLFQKCALRLKSSSVINFKKPITLTNSDFRFVVTEQFQKVKLDPGPIIIEPSGKNTAAAILTASFFALKEDEDAILLVCPSDHLIPDNKLFHEVIKSGLPAVEDGNFVTFGIKPTRPDTGYGYLELELGKSHNHAKLLRFVEKPNSKVANSMFNAGNFLWNAGIFLFKARDMINAFKEHCSKLIDPVDLALKNSKIDLGFLRLEEEAWNRCVDISIDYAIMEKITNIVGIPFLGEWTDLGGWDAVWDAQNPDHNGVAVTRGAIAIDCNNVLLRSENESQQLVGLGLENIIAVAMPDAVLIASKTRAQDVKKVVTELRLNNIQQADSYPTDYRPWGWFESLVLGAIFQVKRIYVNPGAALSLQSHKYRSEHWIVVVGTGRVTVNDDVTIVSEGESVYVPLGAKHRLENPGKGPLIIIEIQTGTYFGEDDIVRYDDIYSRN
jgi:mannose-1-phosphate guanylyltransferase / mannose-6-phosphate isomerase